MTLTGRRLLAGYATGLFPMAKSAESNALAWFDPPRRGILPLGRMHASRSLLRDLRRGGWTATLDTDFDSIVSACAARDETWINAPLRYLYADLYASGRAHAIETLHEGERAGGAFGISLGGAFFGESMFSAKTNGSKVALLWLTTQLHHCGFTLFDTQFMTPHLQSLGGTEIDRADYHRRLAAALALDVRLSGALPDAQSLWQDVTHRS